MHVQWINAMSMAVPVSGLVNYIPLASTVVTCILSIILARATLRYAETTDKGLALAREEFEREWSPELHIKLERISNSEAKVVVTNLAKISVLLQMMQLRKISHAVPFERAFLNDPLVGGMTWTEDVGKRLLTCTGADYEGLLAASVTFYASGRMFRTDWFRFHIQVRNGHILRVHPTKHSRATCARPGKPQGPERRKELVKDVAADLAAGEGRGELMIDFWVV